MPPLPLTAVFGDLPDPRRETGNKLHRLTDILAITTCTDPAAAFREFLAAGAAPDLDGNMP